MFDRSSVWVEFNSALSSVGPVPGWKLGSVSCHVNDYVDTCFSVIYVERLSSELGRFVK